MSFLNCSSMMLQMRRGELLFSNRLFRKNTSNRSKTHYIYANTTPIAHILIYLLFYLF